MPFSIEDQLRLIGPRRFEELCGQLVKSEFPNASHVEGKGGDTRDSFIFKYRHSNGNKILCPKSTNFDKNGEPQQSDDLI